MDRASTSEQTPRWRRVALALAGFKVGYWLVVLGFVGWGAAFNEEQAERIRRTWFPPEPPPAAVGHWARHFATWDAEHYLYLSRHGYAPGLRSIAFYPLWPLAVRLTAPLAGGSHIVAGLILANLLSLAGWVMFHRVTARRFGEQMADVAVGLLVAFPGSLFFQFIYSEALFFLLLMLLWWALEQRRGFIACVAALLLPLVRGVGVFAVLPVGWVVLTRTGVGDPTLREEVRGRPMHRGWWLLVLAPAAGWALYLGLIGHWTGNPWAGVEAQRYWGVQAIANLWDVPKFVSGFLDVTTWHGFTGSILDRLVFLLVLYSLPVQWRLGRDLPAWTLMLAVVPALSGTLVSFVRFAACAFPVFLAGAALLVSCRGRWPLRLVLTTAWIVHAVLLWRFLNYSWAG